MSPVSAHHRLLVVSDIHSNLEALLAVLEDAGKFGPFDARLCAGDIVGYGPSPNKCISLIRKHQFISVLGNHDRAVRGGDMSDFSHYAKVGVTFNQEKLSAESLQFLQSLDNRPYTNLEWGYSLVHGSFAGAPLRGPYSERFEDRYINTVHDFPRLPQDTNGVPTRLGIFGHSHIPTYGHYYLSEERAKLGFPPDVIFEMNEEDKQHKRPATFALSPAIVKVDFGFSAMEQAIFNPGSVGQPRHRIPEACYGIVELTADKIQFEFRSTPYDIEKTQRKMQRAGLPRQLIERLSFGG